MNEPVVVLKRADGTAHSFAPLNAEHEGVRSVRLGFNPSQLDTVLRLKALMATFIAECDATLCEDASKQTKEQQGEAARAFAVAKTNAQTASMWAVLAATTGR